jgi:hypothetical protein
MSGQAISIIVDARRESLGGTLAASAAMHVLLFLLLVGYTTLGSSFGGGWGKNWGSGRVHAHWGGGIPPWRAAARPHAYHA